MPRTLLKLSRDIALVSHTTFGLTALFELQKKATKTFNYFENLQTPAYPMQTWNWACQFWLLEKQSLPDHQAFLINIYDETKQFWIQSVVYQYPWHFQQVFLTIPRGPVCSANFGHLETKLKQKLMQEWLAALNQLLQDTKAVYVKIEPTWDGNQILHLQKPTTELEPEIADLQYGLGAEIARLIPNQKQIQPSKFLQPPYSRTIQPLTELTLPADPGFKQSFETYFETYFESVVQGFETKTRYNARLARKKGMSVEWSKSDENFEAFWQIMLLTADRQHFKPYRREYYQHVLANSWADLALVRSPEGEVTNAWMGSFIAGMGMYLYGGSNVQFGALKGAELIHSAAIIRTLQAGYGYYDMGGTSLLDGAMPAWDGYSKFKKGFGGRIVEYLPHSYDYISRPRIYSGVSFTINTAKNLLGKSKKISSGDHLHS